MNPVAIRQTEIPYREWPWHQRVAEQLYRWTHHGQIRTLVIRRDDKWPPR